jgi:glycosyltransferase involved in cell wall biosynthesis
MKIALVAPHMFMHESLMHKTIFAPGALVLDLATGLTKLGVDVTLFSPKLTLDGVKTINADLSLFDEELRLRGYGYLELLQKHPFVFATLGRQVQNELISKAYGMANQGEFDLVHIYMNEEESALAFANLCQKPVIFTHHEPFNYLTKYRSSFPKYKDLNWLSISYSQRRSMPEDTNFVENIYHGIAKDKFKPNFNPKADYFLFFGRIIEPKGVHLAIQAAKKAGVKLKIAGKHYAEFGKDSYWETQIKPNINNQDVEYLGFISDLEEKQGLIGNAKAMLMPSIWDEPFGLVMLESMACGTPVIGLDSGAIPELIKDNQAGLIVHKKYTDQILDIDKTIDGLVKAINSVGELKRSDVREYFEENFTLENMAKNHYNVYQKLIQGV